VIRRFTGRMDMWTSVREIILVRCEREGQEPHMFVRHAGFVDQNLIQRRRLGFHKFQIDRDGDFIADHNAAAFKHAVPR
jgi:hypothetical protein